jgi:WD40 repeat protein
MYILLSLILIYLQGAKDASITHLVLSENGYHMASASSKGDVTVWDLRKSAKVDSFQIPSNGDNQMSPLVTRLSFCPLGKYLACGTKSGQVYLCPVKDMSQVFTVATTSNHEGGISGLLWGVNAQSLITCNDHDRGVQFWGIPSKGP